jgi:hypothetical protein
MPYSILFDMISKLSNSILTLSSTNDNAWEKISVVVHRIYEISASCISLLNHLPISFPIPV